MRKITLDELDETIKERRKKVNESLVNETSSKKQTKTRIRSKAERDALDEISIRRWEKAEEAGKVKRIGERRLYYDYN